MVTAGKVIWVLVECDFAGTVFTVQGELAAGFALNQQRKAETLKNESPEVCLMTKPIHGSRGGLRAPTSGALSG